MKRVLNVAVALVILLVLLGYMITYTVRFNETAIVTTFGSVSENSIINAPVEGEAIGGGEAGLHFKWPWPIQQVARKYDTRTQVLESSLDQQLTADRQSVNVSLYITWRVTDPLKFYQKLGTITAAQQQLRVQLRGTMSVIGDYQFDELVNADESQLRLEELEQEMVSQIRDTLNEADYGIAVEELGIQRIVLPATVTSSVFERMQAERARIAAAARSRGEAESNSLINRAQSDAATITSFAQARASQIEGEGLQRAQEIFARFAEDEEFAIFLAQLEALREVLAEKTRFILDTSRPPFSLLRGLAPDSLNPVPEDDATPPPPSEQVQSPTTPPASPAITAGGATDD